MRNFPHNPRQRRGRAIKARTLNETAAQGESVGRIQIGQGVRQISLLGTPHALTSGSGGSSGTLRKLVTTTGIGAASWDGSGNITPGSGAATELEWNSGTGKWTPIGSSYTIRNPYRGTVDSSRLIWCAEITDGPADLELVAAECYTGGAAASFGESASLSEGLDAIAGDTDGVGSAAGTSTVIAAGLDEYVDPGGGGP